METKRTVTRLMAGLAVLGLFMSLTHPAGAMKDPPPLLGKDYGALALASPTAPGAVVVAGTISGYAVRDYTNSALSYPGVICWTKTITKPLVNRYGDSAATPRFHVDWCSRAGLVVAGTVWWGGSSDGYLHMEAPVTANWGSTGGSKRYVEADWDYGFGVSGWLNYNIDVDLYANYYADGRITGRWEWNGAG